MAGLNDPKRSAHFSLDRLSGPWSIWASFRY